jgi:hypothetical protein
LDCLHLKTKAVRSFELRELLAQRHGATFPKLESSAPRPTAPQISQCSPVLASSLFLFKILDKPPRRSTLFRDITLRRVVVVHRLFGTTYRCCLLGPRVSDPWPLKMGPIRCPETSVSNYHTTQRNIPEERRSRQRRGGSLKSNHHAVFGIPKKVHET